MTDLAICAILPRLTYNTRFIFYKNELYKNIEAEKPQKFKNILRIL